MLRDWTKKRNPNNGAHWVIARSRVFAVTIDSKKRKALRLFTEADTPIRRHIKIISISNPYDPEWQEYFDTRKNRGNETSTGDCCRVT